MVKELAPIKDVLNLNTHLFFNLLEGVGEEVLYKRPVPNTNSLIFVVIHLLDARFYIAKFCGVRDKNPFKDKFDKINTSDDINDLPDLTEIKNAWEDISAKLLKEIGNVTEKRLSQNPRMEFPVTDKTILGAINFLTQHESYHLGQLGLMRKIFGLSSISYN